MAMARLDFHILHSFYVLFALMMETVGTSETSVNFYETWLHVTASQKTVFYMLAAARTWNLTRHDTVSFLDPTSALTFYSSKEKDDTRQFNLQQNTVGMFRLSSLLCWVFPYCNSDAESVQFTCSQLWCECYKSFMQEPSEHTMRLLWACIWGERFVWRICWKVQTACYIL
jgi:hypothetical protein